MNKTRLATLWLDGCSGCHMSFLDMDDLLLDLAQKVEFVFSPLVDSKTFPPDVDITFVEGALGTQADLERIRLVRRNTRILVAFGDCAVTGNIPSMRNPYGREEILRCVYLEKEPANGIVPDEDVPPLLPDVLPIHQVVSVDLFLPGCPPSAQTIHFTLEELIQGRTPDLTRLTRFGA